MGVYSLSYFAKPSSCLAIATIRSSSEPSHTSVERCFQSSRVFSNETYRSMTLCNEPRSAAAQSMVVGPGDSISSTERSASLLVKYSAVDINFFISFVKLPLQVAIIRCVLFVRSFFLRNSDSPRSIISDCPLLDPSNDSRLAILLMAQTIVVGNGET